MASYLDFEDSIRQLDASLAEARLKSDLPAVEVFQKQLSRETVKVYSGLSDYQKLQLARHPDRPYALDYIRFALDDAYEIHGDRAFGDDKAVLCYVGYLAARKVVFIGEQKGRGTKQKLECNFGMPHPEGYRKALRVAKMAEKFHLPIVFLVDTPGAYPGIGAEQRGQSEAIARNLYELSNLDTPSLAIIIGEGGSGGALAVSVADKVAMMRYSVFSVISPEGCAAILWNDPKKQKQATKAMKITADDLKHFELIDAIIDEPLIGAHRDKAGALQVLKDYCIETLDALDSLSSKVRLEKRYERLVSVGAYTQDS